MSASPASTTIRSPERWSQWARKLASRGTRLRANNPLAMQLLRRAQARAALRQYRTFMPLSLSVDLHFAFASPSAARLYATSRDRVTEHTTSSPAELQRSSIARHASQLETTHRVEQQAAVELRHRTDAAQQLLSRILERTERREERSRAREVVYVHAGRLAAPQARDEDMRPRTNGSPAQPFEASAPATWAQPPRIPAAPPVNLDQIADTVMRRLDHRIEAWRERTGRR